MSTRASTGQPRIYTLEVQTWYQNGLLGMFPMSTSITCFDTLRFDTTLLIATITSFLFSGFNLFFYGRVNLLLVPPHQQQKRNRLAAAGLLYTRPCNWFFGHLETSSSLFHVVGDEI